MARKQPDVPEIPESETSDGTTYFRTGTYLRAAEQSQTELAVRILAGTIPLRVANEYLDALATRQMLRRRRKSLTREADEAAAHAAHWEIVSSVIDTPKVQKAAYAFRTAHMIEVARLLGQLSLVEEKLKENPWPELPEETN